MNQSDYMFVRDVLDSVVTGTEYDIEDVINALEMVEGMIEDVDNGNPA